MGGGVTLSTGTSAVAVAGAVANGWCESPVTVHLEGVTCKVKLDESFNARLTGAAQEICVGEVSAELLEEAARG